MNVIVKFVNDLLTGIDNQTFDIARVLWAVTVVTFLVLSCWNVVETKQPFDYQQFGIGAGLVLAGGGAGVALKGRTEPQGN
jgi:hypothetical protein